MKILRHRTTRYWQFVDNLEHTKSIDTIICDQYGQTISRKILETDIETYVQAQIKAGYILEYSGVDNQQMKARGKRIVKRSVWY